MAVSVTDKPLILIAELNKRYLDAQKNAGPRLWTEISSGLRMAAAAGETQITVPVPNDVKSFIENRLRKAGLTFVADGTNWTITGWADWKDPEAKEEE